MLFDTGTVALGVVIALSIVVPLTVLAAVCWLFWRSARRFDAEQADERSRNPATANPRRNNKYSNDTTKKQPPSTRVQKKPTLRPRTKPQRRYTTALS